MYDRDPEWAKAGECIVRPMGHQSNGFCIVGITDCWTNGMSQKPKNHNEVPSDACYVVEQNMKVSKACVHY